MYVCHLTPFFLTGIWKCIKGERKSASGYAWRKAEGDDSGVENLAVTNISGLAALKSVIKVAAKTEFDRPVEQRDQFGRLIKTHKSVKSITCFVPTQKVITKICEEGGGEVTLDEGKTFRFRYKKMPMGNALAGAGVLGIPLPIGSGGVAGATSVAGVATTGVTTKKRNRSVFDAHHNLPEGTAALRIATSSSSSSSSSSSISSSSSSGGTNNQAAVEVGFKAPAAFSGSTVITTMIYVNNTTSDSHNCILTTIVLYTNHYPIQAGNPRSIYEAVGNLWSKLRAVSMRQFLALSHPLTTNKIRSQPYYFLIHPPIHPTTRRIQTKSTKN